MFVPADCATSLDGVVTGAAGISGAADEVCSTGAVLFSKFSG